MTRRERLERKAGRLREWADKREISAAANHQRSHDLVKDIPLGQPILVGHHSEGRHRRTLDRSWNALGRAVEDTRKAEDMNSRAANIQSATEGAIYLDDPDAIERLTAKLADLEGQRDAMKAENAAFRKGDAAYAAYKSITIEQAAAVRVKINEGYSWCRQPYPSYSLQNLGGTITKERKRLASLQAAKTPRGTATTDTSAETATARAGLIITATQTTPVKAWKKPRPVWNISGNLAYWRPLLERLGGSLYHGVISFWEDPTEDIENALTQEEAK